MGLKGRSGRVNPIGVWGVALWVIFMACSTNRTEREYFPDKTVSVEYHLSDGQKHGTYTSYYRNGAIRQKAQYHKGLLEGEVIHFDSLGRLLWKANYRQDTIEGHFLEYHPSGMVSTDAHFDKGVQNGVYRTYFPNGQEKVTTSYLNGVHHGTFTERYHNGVLRMKAWYDSGQLLTSSEYDSTGRMVMSFVNDSAEISIPLSKGGLSNGSVP